MRAMIHTSWNEESPKTLGSLWTARSREIGGHYYCLEPVREERCVDANLLGRTWNDRELGGVESEVRAQWHSTVGWKDRFGRWCRV
jgi:hypothetical protein